MAVVITPIGHLDSKTSPEFEALLVDLLGQGRKSYLIDFSAVETISSAALRVLLMFTRKLRTTGGSLALSSLNSHVRQVFDISGFTASFKISDSRATALEFFAAGDSRAVETARAAARILGVMPPPRARRDRRDRSVPAGLTGALALQLLKQASSEIPSRSGSDGAPPGEIAESPTDDPVLEVSGGAGAAPALEVSAVSDLWHRLRQHLGSRR